MFNKKGFTVVEVLVVLMIISILALIIIIVVTGKTTDAKYIQAMADLDALRTAITLYQIDLGNFPPSTDPSTAPIAYGNAVLLKALTVSMSGSASTTSTLWRGPYIDIKKMRLSADEKRILDPWENEYSYIVYTDYSTQNDWRTNSLSADSIYFGTYNSNSTDIYENPLTYQIFSIGKNGLSNTTTTNGSTSGGGTDKDDVNNWYGDQRKKQ